MNLEKIVPKISREKVADLIIDSAVTEHDMPFDKLEAKIVAKIVNGFPEKMNRHAIAKWCNTVVKSELEKYPQLQESFEIIKNDVASKIYKALHDIEDESKTNEKLMDDLVEILEKENPKDFNYTYLFEKHRKIFHQIYYQFISKPNVGSRVGWRDFKNALPEMWQDKFKVPRDMSILATSERIREWFELHPDEKFSPRHIEMHLASDYVSLQAKMPRNSKGQIEWNVLLDLLPNDISVRWRRKHRHVSELLPENQYKDDTEIMESLKDFSSHDFTLFYVKKNDDIQKNRLEELSKLLISLAQKGNLAAYEKLAGHLFFYLEGYVESRPQLQLWQYATDEMQKLIYSCVYLYDPQKGDFFRYLKYSLKKRVESVRSSLRKNAPSDGMKISQRGEFYEENDET